MEGQVAGNTCGQVGRSRKYAKGWNSANKQIYVSNDKFTKWQKLKEKKLVNNDAVASYLLSTVEHLNNIPEHERLVLLK